MIRAGLDINAIVSGVIVFCILLLLALIVESAIFHGGARDVTLAFVSFWIVHTIITLVRYGAATRMMVLGLHRKRYFHAILLFCLCGLIFAVFTIPLLRSGISETTAFYIIEATAGVTACFGVVRLANSQTG